MALTPATDPSPRGALALLKQTFIEWSHDHARTHAASLAYYAVFSLAPMLVIALAIAGAVFGEDAARGAVQTQLEGIIGASSAATVQAAIMSAGRHGSGALATVLGVCVMVFAAARIFGELQAALNDIWKAKPRPSGSVRAFLRTRLLSLMAVFFIGFLLLVSLAASAALSAFSAWVGSSRAGWIVVTQLLDVVVSIVTSTLLFALLFKLLPDVKVAWRDVWLGAAVSAVLFTLGKFAISQYLTISAVRSSYGAVGSFAALMAWVYFSSMTMLWGAELAKVYSRARRPPST